LHIEEAVDARIFTAAFDFNNKRIVLDKFFIPSGNVVRDLDTLKVYYSKFSAKKPENY
jgi:hypothetical protein